MNGDAVRRFVLALNDTWQRGDVEALADFYHPDVVLLPPDLGVPIRGRESVVASYRDFLDAARLDRFQPVELEVFSFPAADGGSHAAHLTFEVDYTLDADRYVEKGLEVYVIQEHDNRLQIIWRQQSVLDSRLAGKSEPH